MNLSEELEAFLSRCKASISQQRRRKQIILYASGLKLKLRQTSYCIFALDQYSNVGDCSANATSGDEYLVAERVPFYCDAFWASAYSCLDFLAQLVNQAMKLELKEDDVSFKQVLNKLGSTAYSNMPVAQKVRTCANSHIFKNLAAYRHCSTHRRPIYIEEITQIIKGTEGYESDSTSGVTTVLRVLCDNPQVQKPKCRSRFIPDYLSSMNRKLQDQMCQILRVITPTS